VDFGGGCLETNNPPQCLHFLKK